MECENADEKKTPSGDGLDEYKKKSLELTIDSLKLYITIATFSFGGLLAIYNTIKNPDHTWLFYFSLVLFVSSIIMSMYIINTFINEVYLQSFDIKKKPLPKLNFMSIGLLVLGFVSAIVFIVWQPATKPPVASNLVIENGIIKASGSLASKFSVQIDSVNKTKSFILDLK